MRITGLEPAREAHWYLKPARLPIPPYPHFLIFSECIRKIILTLCKSNKIAETSQKISAINEASGIRTPDNLIKSQVLYHLSYTPVSFYSLFANKNAQNRNRTSDTRIFSPLLYRLSYLGIHTNV